MAVTAYCDQDDIEDWISEAGVQLRIDDIPPNDLGRSIEKASSIVNFYCLQRYSAAELAANDFIQDVASLFATRFLCMRRGNPPPASVKILYDEYIEMLKEIKSGASILPGATPKKLGGPVMVNTTWRLRPTPHGRVRKGTSTGTVTSYPQRVDGQDPGTYGALDYSI